jgi:crotonobetainyl-CoA:carnitine CoA-transferase CaiB-like acyl-CoA transferase
VNPGLIYCSITGFGQDGPYAHRAGYDYIIQGMSGLMSITGEAGGRAAEGRRRGHRHLHRASIRSTAILAALHQNAPTGRGRTST